MTPKTDRSTTSHPQRFLPQTRPEEPLSSPSANHAAALPKEKPKNNVLSFHPLSIVCSEFELTAYVPHDATHRVARIVFIVAICEILKGDINFSFDR